MIFKQRQFTALLGVLFAVALTDQASALYDPGVGRFCSRDPIGYADGKNAYQNYFITIATDPYGTKVEIEILRSRPNAFSAPCPGLLSKKWLFLVKKQ